MTHEQMDTLLKRITSDDDFAGSLAADPAAAAAGIGMTLSAEETQVISEMNADELKSFASEQLAISDPTKRRAAC